MKTVQMANVKATQKRKPYVKKRVSQVDVSKHLFIARETVSKLVRDGVIPAPDNRQKDTWDLDACREAYITYLKNLVTRRGRPRKGEEKGSSEGSLTAHRINLEALRAEKLQIEIEALRGKYILASDVEHMIATIVKTCQSKFRNLAPKAARKFGLSRKVSKALQSMIDAILRELAASKYEPIEREEDEAA